MGFGKDNRGVILRDSISSAVGALAQNIAVIAGGLGLEEDFRMLKTRAVAGLTGLTATEGQGLMLGIAQGDLTIGQIAECLTANGPLGPSDRILQERAERMCHVVGVGVPRDDAETRLQFLDAETGAPMITSKFPWTFSDDDSWQWFIFNPSAGGITTGATLFINATHYGVWVV